MIESRSGRQLNPQAYSYEKERIKHYIAYLLLFAGTVLFLLSAMGAFNGISQAIQDKLVDSLGYTNRWSKTFGPSWFVHIVNGMSALGGKVIIFLGIVITAGYYKVRKDNKRLWKFLFVVLGGIASMLTLKFISADEIPYEPVDLLINNISSYPSGHAMMGMIFYLTIAVFLTRKQRRSAVRKYTLTVSYIIVFLIGISRIFDASHSFTEVVAGWSAGMIWLCLCWLAERFIKKHSKWEI